MPARVAVVGDVSATPSATLHTDTAIGPGTATASGTWTAGTIAYESYPQLSAAGAEVIWQAECEFSFTGTSIAGSAVNARETVTLTATAKLLNADQDHVLVDGDSKSSPAYGNKLAVSAAGPLLAD
jgi:hypothetical protein